MSTAPPPDEPHLPHAGAVAAPPPDTFIRCPNCGYNLTGVALGSSCPECNLIIGRGTLTGKALPTSGAAVASLVLGICSITIGCGTYGVLSVVCGPLALFFAAQASRQIRAGGVSAGSSGLRTAGLVTGLIGTVVGVLFVGGILLTIGLVILSEMNP